MAQSTPKLEILIDLSKPAEEIIHCIALIANAHPGKQQEILQQVDLWLGETLAKVEEEQVNSIPVEQSESMTLKSGDPK